MDHRVLVADSDVSLATVYECYLESHGFDVAIATDGVDCFEMLQQFRPDFLVMESDILWGGADGVLGYLRSGDGVHSTSVILVADAPPDVLPELIAPPVIAVLQKPFRLRTLLTLLRSPQQSNQSRQALADSLSRHTPRSVPAQEIAVR